MSAHRHVETLTVHVHGQCGLHRPEKGGVLGMTCQLPPIVRAQSCDPLREGRRREEDKNKVYVEPYKMLKTSHHGHVLPLARTV